jgi:hypothetical protein
MKGPGPSFNKFNHPKLIRKLGVGSRLMKNENGGDIIIRSGLGIRGLRRRDKQNKARSITLSLGDR